MPSINSIRDSWAVDGDTFSRLGDANLNLVRGVVVIESLDGVLEEAQEHAVELCRTPDDERERLRIGRTTRTRPSILGRMSDNVSSMP